MLVIEDDGKGFDAEALNAEKTGGLGLTSIRERARILGGHVALETSPGKGASLRIELPV
jgi:two-component system NarL family sensor kinase